MWKPRIHLPNWIEGPTLRIDGLRTEPRELMTYETAEFKSVPKVSNRAGRRSVRRTRR